MPVFNGGNGGGMAGRREYTRESYGKTVSGGGARRSGGGPKPGRPNDAGPGAIPSASPFQLQPDGQPRPQIPNMTPPQTPISGPPLRGAIAPPDRPNFANAGAAAPQTEDFGSAAHQDALTQQRTADYFRPLTPEETARQSAGVEAGRAIDAAGPGGGAPNPMADQVKAYGDMVGQDFKKQVGGLLGDLNGIGALRSGATVTGVNDLTTNYGRQIGNYAAMTAGQQAELSQRESQFARTYGLDEKRFASDSAYRDAALRQSGSQFDRSLGEQGREYDSTLGQRDKEFQTDASYRQNQANFNNADTMYERNFRDRQYEDQKSASRKRGIGKLLGGIAGGVGGFIVGGPGGAVAGAKTGSSIFGG